MRTLRAIFICGALAASLAVFLYTHGAFTALTRLSFGAAGAEIPSPLWTQWLGAILLGFGLAWTTIAIASLALKAVAAVVALVETAVLAWVLHLCGLQWPPITALAAGLFGTAFGFLYTLSPPGQRKRTIEKILGGRISRATFTQLVESNEPLSFSGQEREASVVVCQLFNRQNLAETLPVPDYVALSNAFLQAVSEALLDAGGVLIESDGERPFAVFGAPLADPAHATQASKAALALCERLEAFRGEARNRWNAAPEYGIAVNTGALIAGVFGTPTLGKFAVTGEAVDFCWRLCRANPAYGTRILAGPQIAQLAREAVELRPVELIWNHATQTREELYELLALKNGLSPVEQECREVFWKGVVLCRAKRWKEAAAHFEAVLTETHCEDALARFYAERVAREGEGEGTILDDRR